MKNQLQNYIKAGYGALSMTTNEYFRCMADVTEATLNLNGVVMTWDARGDLTNLVTGKSFGKELYSPIIAFEYIRGFIADLANDDGQDYSEPYVFIINDFHLYMGNPDPAMLAMFRDLVQEGASANCHLLLVGATHKLCPEIENLVTKLEFDLPSRERIEQSITAINASIENEHEIDEHEMSRIVNSCSGMTSTEIDDALALSVVTTQKIDWQLIMKEKSKAVSKTGCLKYHDTKLKREDVGGLEELISYVSIRKNSFSKEAVAFGCPPPKGIILVGIAGTGKSLTAKVTADILERPLISMDIGAVFGGIVGASEENMRTALKTIEAISPCVLMLDEIEKGLSGTKSSGKSDGGTGARVMGTLLTWMNDNESDVYVVATSNDVSALPPELLRKGRFDELFFVDLPNDAERQVIINIHLKKRGRKPEDFDVKKLVGVTEGFTGAEIEQVIIDAMYVAFDKGGKLLDKHITDSISVTSPLSVINATKVKELRDWSANRCRSASTKAKAKKAPAKKKVTARRIAKD